MAKVELYQRVTKIPRTADVLVANFLRSPGYPIQIFRSISPLEDQFSRYAPNDTTVITTHKDASPHDWLHSRLGLPLKSDSHELGTRAGSFAILHELTRKGLYSNKDIAETADFYTQHTDPLMGKVMTQLISDLPKSTIVSDNPFQRVFRASGFSLWLPDRFRMIKSCVNPEHTHGEMKGNSGGSMSSGQAENTFRTAFDQTLKWLRHGNNIETMERSLQRLHNTVESTRKTGKPMTLNWKMAPIVDINKDNAHSTR